MQTVLTRTIAPRNTTTCSSRWGSHPLTWVPVGAAASTSGCKRRYSGYERREQHTEATRARTKRAADDSHRVGRSAIFESDLC